MCNVEDRPRDYLGRLVTKCIITVILVRLFDVQYNRSIILYVQVIAWKTNQTNKIRFEGSQKFLRSLIVVAKVREPGEALKIWMGPPARLKAGKLLPERIKTVAKSGRLNNWHGNSFFGRNDKKWQKPFTLIYNSM